MNISARQSHLSEMGIPQWYSRFELLGAAQSPSMEIIPQEADLASLPSEKPKITLATTKNLVASTEVLDSVAISKPQNASDIKPEVPVIELSDDCSDIKNAVPRMAQSFVPPISLAVFVADEYIAISDVGSEVSYQEEQVLLQNILKAVVLKGTDFQFKERFSWPVFNSTKVLSDYEGVHEALLARWFDSLQLSQYHPLMYFGSQNKELIVQSLDSSRSPVFFDDSLSNLLRMPVRKANVWKVLTSNRNKMMQGKAK